MSVWDIWDGERSSESGSRPDSNSKIASLLWPISDEEDSQLRNSRDPGPSYQPALMSPLPSSLRHADPSGPISSRSLAHSSSNSVKSACFKDDYQELDRSLPPRSPLRVVNTAPNEDAGFSPTSHSNEQKEKRVVTDYVAEKEELVLKDEKQPYEVELFDTSQIQRNSAGELSRSELPISGMSDYRINSPSSSSRDQVAARSKNSQARTGYVPVSVNGDGLGSTAHIGYRTGDNLKAQAGFRASLDEVRSRRHWPWRIDGPSNAQDSGIGPVEREHCNQMLNRYAEDVDLLQTELDRIRNAANHWEMVARSMSDSEDVIERRVKFIEAELQLNSGAFLKQLTPEQLNQIGQASAVSTDIQRPKTWLPRDFEFQDDGSQFKPGENLPFMTADHSQINSFLCDDAKSQGTELLVEIYLAHAKVAYRNRHHKKMIRMANKALAKCEQHFPQYTPLQARCKLYLAIASYYEGNVEDALHYIVQTSSCVGVYQEGDMFRGWYNIITEAIIIDDKEEADKHDRVFANEKGLRETAPNGLNVQVPHARSAHGAFGEYDSAGHSRFESMYSPPWQQHDYNYAFHPTAHPPDANKVPQDHSPDSLSLVQSSIGDNYNVRKMFHHIGGRLAAMSDVVPLGHAHAIEHADDIVACLPDQQPQRPTTTNKKDADSIDRDKQPRRRIRDYEMKAFRAGWRDRHQRTLDEQRVRDKEYQRDFMARPVDPRLVMLPSPPGRDGPYVEDSPPWVPGQDYSQWKKVVNSSDPGLPQDAIAQASGATARRIDRTDGTGQPPRALQEFEGHQGYWSMPLKVTQLQNDPELVKRYERQKQQRHPWIPSAPSGTSINSACDSNISRLGLEGVQPAQHTKGSDAMSRNIATNPDLTWDCAVRTKLPSYAPSNLPRNRRGRKQRPDRLNLGGQPISPTSNGAPEAVQEFVAPRTWDQPHCARDVPMEDLEPDYDVPMATPVANGDWNGPARHLSLDDGDVRPLLSTTTHQIALSQSHAPNLAAGGAVKHRPGGDVCIHCKDSFTSAQNHMSQQEIERRGDVTTYDPGLLSGSTGLPQYSHINDRNIQYHMIAPNPSNISTNPFYDMPPSHLLPSPLLSDDPRSSSVREAINQRPRSQDSLYKTLIRDVAGGTRAGFVFKQQAGMMPSMRSRSAPESEHASPRGNPTSVSPTDNEQEPSSGLKPLPSPTQTQTSIAVRRPEPIPQVRRVHNNEI